MTNDLNLADVHWPPFFGLATEALGERFDLFFVMVFNLVREESHLLCGSFSEGSINGHLHLLSLSIVSPLTSVALWQCVPLIPSCGHVPSWVEVSAGHLIGSQLAGARNAGYPPPLVLPSLSNPDAKRCVTGLDGSTLIV